MSQRLALHPHPDSESVLESLEVELVRLAPRRILLRVFLGRGREHIKWPVLPLKPQRLEEMWLHTCFEAFIRPEGEAGYFELNLLPSLHWAAYRFDDYREGMRIATEVDRPHGEPGSYERPADYAFSITLEMARAAALPIDRPWAIGLSAIVEDKRGGKSWWALRHPPGRPDFHHEDCFALQLPAARPA
jgi:hypothetical protein